MENNNYSYSSSYPDSNTSTPRSSEVDCDTASYDEQLTTNNPNPNKSNYKVKFLCSYGGKILPRPHDNQLTYVGGDTKILTLDRNARYSSLLHKLYSLSDSSDICIKYQFPGEDLDALISVTNDEDLEHMMVEYDRLSRGSVKPARLRLFLFPLSVATFGGDDESKSERQWFVDALNSVQISSAEDSSPASVENPDFLFGFDKGNAPAPPKVQDVSAVVAPRANVSEGVRAGSECGSEDNNRHVIGDPVVSPAMGMQRQMQEFQRMQIPASHEQATNPNPRAYYGDYYTQKMIPQVQTPAAVGQPQYWQEQRHINNGGYSMSAAGGDSPVYLIQTPGVYQTPAHSIRPQVGQGQGHHGMQRFVNPAEVYQEQQMYNTVPQPSIQQPKSTTYAEAIGMGRLPPEHMYGQVGFDATGRQFYYTTQQRGVFPSYQPASATTETRQGGGLAGNQEASKGS